MKSLFLLLIVCFSCSLSAQTWAPFPLDDGAQWAIEKGSLTNGCWVTQNLIYYVDGDTMINSKTYSVINYSGTYWSQTAESQNPDCNVWPPIPISGVRGYLRAENGVYYMLGWNQELVLYDLTQEVGDTVAGPTGGEVHLVDSIDVVNIGGTECKRIWFVSTGGIQSIVDGVGSTHGLFEEMFFFEFYNGLNCYGHNGIPLYPEEAFCNLPEPIGVDGLHEIANKPNVSPNPSTGIFNLKTQEKPTIKVCDLFGRLVLQDQLNGSSEIDLTAQPNGLYLLMVETEKGVSTTKLVKQ